VGKYEAKITEIKEKIVREIKPEKIILFGSYAWGKPTEDSDVDLFIIKDSTEKKIKRAREVREAISNCDVPVDVLVYTPDEIKKSINENRNLFIEDILRNGKTIYEKSKNTFGVVFPKRSLIVLQ
jgi:predicted nucleotidyltransferase